MVLDEWCQIVQISNSFENRTHEDDITVGRELKLINCTFFPTRGSQGECPSLFFGKSHDRTSIHPCWI